MSPPASPSPFAAAVAATARKLSRDARKSETKEAKRPRQSSPSPSPSTSTSTSTSTSSSASTSTSISTTAPNTNTNTLWKGLQLTSTSWIIPSRSNKTARKRKFEARKWSKLSAGRERNGKPQHFLFGEGEKRTSDRAGPTSSIAALATRTQRKVFSAGFFYAKKLKRFQKDSPSSPSRRREGGLPRNTSIASEISGVSVVDLCSSDEDDKPPPEKASASANDPPPRKDPPLTNETPMMTSGIAVAVGAGSAAAAASGATSPGSKSIPPVDLCSSDEEVGEDDTDCAVAVATPKAPPPNFEKEYSIVEAAKGTKDPSKEPQGGIQSLSSEAALLSVSATIATANSNQRETAPSPPRPSWKDFSKKTAERQSEILESTGTALVANHETKTGSSPSFEVSTERKRHLLDVLVPKSLSPEAITIEDWEAADELAVSKAFSERFGSLRERDMEKLAEGEFLVPEGMVAVKEVLRSYRLLRTQTKTSPLEQTPSEATTTTNQATERQNETIEKEEPPTPAVGVDGDNPSYGEETASEGRQESQNNFQWDGTFRLLPNKRAMGNSSCFDFYVGKINEDDYVRKENVETKATSWANDDHEGWITKSPEEDPSIGKDRDQSTDTCNESQNTENEGNEIERPALLEQHVSDNETAKPKDACKGDGQAMGGPKEANNSIGNTIVGYGGDNSPAERQECHPRDFREARAVLSQIVTNIVDTVTTGCRQEQEQHPAEAETEIMFGDAASLRQLRLEGSSETDLFAMSRCDEEKQGEKNRPLIVVSAKQLLLLALPLVCLAGIFRRLGLFDVSNSILEGSFRTFLQLHVLGSLLSPIFKHGANHPGLVGCYALFMIVLASYEASSRTKYTHDAQFTIIVQSLVMNVGWVAMWAFGVILKPRPVWNPRYLLPIIGMLLGNSINGISITLDTIATSLVEKQSEVDLYLSFGANQYEAVSGIVAHAIQKGTTPSFNMMCVVGIVSIPGMMTGQILGGSSPIVAARYQAMIIFLIALSTLSTILMSSCLTVISAFCSHQILRPDRFVKNRKRGLARLILWLWGYVFGGGSDLIPVGIGGNSGGFLADEEMNTILRPPATGFEIRPLKKGSVVSDGEGMNSLVQASGLHRYFVVGDGSNEDTAAISGTDHRRVLFQDLSFHVNEGDLLLVSGPSGTGKSELLRMMAGLSPLQEGSLRLQGRSWKDDYNGNNAVEWRKQIRYVTQTKVQIPGTPLQFIKKIQSFRSWKADDDRSDAVTDYDMMKHVSHHIRQWGMGLECLDKEWSVLSGGESQRVLMAIALASRPKVLLFDESTSALDHKSKLAVETSIKDFVEDHVGGVLWVSHDEQQAERMMGDSESIGVYGH